MVIHERLRRIFSVLHSYNIQFVRLNFSTQQSHGYNNSFWLAVDEFVVCKQPPAHWEISSIYNAKTDKEIHCYVKHISLAFHLFYSISSL